MTPKPATPEFAQIFAELRAILKKYEPDLRVEIDTPKGYYLNTNVIWKNEKPMFFAAAHPRKSYVSFYLMPLYVFPDLLEGMSPELKSRMQGKSCFNFTGVDRALFRELAALTRSGYERFRKEGLA